MVSLATMSSIELVAVINELREAGRAELRHDNFMVKIESHPAIDSPKFLGHVQVPGPNGSSRKSKCYHLPKREVELMVMSESLAVQGRVYDRMVELEGIPPKVAASRDKDDSGLPAMRKAKALQMNIESAKALCAMFPNLGAQAQQTIFAKVVGMDMIQLPVLEAVTYSAGEVGVKLGVTANQIGRISNAHGLKTTEYGMFVLDKSRSSVKQVESFRYNDAGVAKLAELLGQSPKPSQGDLLGDAS